MNKLDRLECSAILIQSSVELSPASFPLIFGRQAGAYMLKLRRLLEQKAQTPTFLVGIILICACLNPNACFQWLFLPSRKRRWIKNSQSAF
ncbi:Undecaprenyl-diphosphatase [Trichinella spiralis]|uniref:Undecaprenyl-diphosphatase n=1 Tax=Trichinella spiralis TaxID=6334 RepID=A0ABR3KQU9_TRISP